ncbi:hypothetical protein RHS04_07896 [Rhizoctonia solani]|uniref:Uncharacterized protein n=1 Tax=Rhizoctonia solani TaxID=456999 RepID=A0A8H7LJV5_9AGAM|nr:hypothetical protein RHS04_07896 [Rhizoctonia solani]
MRGDRTMRAMHLGSSVIQALNQDAWAQYHGPKRYFNWINQFEQRLATDFADGPSLTDVRDNLTAHLELVMLKLAVVDSTSAYILLRDALPKFLLLVSTESDLLIERPNGSLTISFPRTLNSPRHELVRFVTYDSLMGLLLGVPPLVEYVYEGACGVDQCERVHGIPTACFQILSQVNSSRTGSSACLENWRVLEQRVLEWGSPHVISAAPAPEAANIEQATIKEIWRHLLLIYIYMGMGGASSHDSRVQASVDHIFYHAETLGTSRIGIHMLPHCIAAGVAARLERHRVAIYRKLMSFTDARPWFSCGPQFSQFLHHLWHGAGDGGRAVTWDDYIQARQQVIPI